MIVDLHAHESLYSACSRMTLEEAVSSARSGGLHGLCITDHDSLSIRDHEYLRGLDFPVFIGVEMYTREGDIIALGLDVLPPPRPGAQEFIDFAVARGAFCFAAHPFRAWGGGLGERLYSLRNLHGVEVLNGANSDAENHEAMEACAALGLIPVGASDAHVPEAVGRYATWFPEDLSSVRELAEALKAGLGRPVIRKKDNSYEFFCL
ncbi:MAG: PHP domain-containing protein [Deltaproteobacteria bacterium]|jgi:predicted metal-dependent phosphoesterase TrpH|nr:PHP domain-containing protein [Deltaproteobacteria bacterium]